MTLLWHFGEGTCYLLGNPSGHTADFHLSVMKLFLVMLWMSLNDYLSETFDVLSYIEIEIYVDWGLVQSQLTKSTYKVDLQSQLTK
jgi:hypothetical protein